MEFLYRDSKDFPKERYNTYAKSCNSNLYTYIYIQNTLVPPIAGYF